MQSFEDAELRQTARLWRALLDRFLDEFEPAESGEPTLLDRVERHLGVNPLSLPVVTERWAPHELADVQLALEHWLRTSAAAVEIVGTPHHARRHQTFAEMPQYASRDDGFIVGAMDGCVAQAGGRPAGRGRGSAARVAVRGGLVPQ